MKKKISIFETLSLLGLTSDLTKELYSKRTRDVAKLKVYKDKVTGVIYIDDFYVGDKVFKSGSYREKESPEISSRNLERFDDAERRFNTYKNAFIGKKIIDFGCGEGHFLKLAKNHCASAVGIDLQVDLIKSLKKIDIEAYENLDSIKDQTIDTIFAFHALEHLPNLIDQLDIIKRKLSKGGKIIMEVPHANDFLLKTAKSQKFKDFTLWSQHLVLHTRDSLSRLLNHVGFEDIIIEGVQRYSLANHLTWLSDGLPGGHKSKLSILDDKNLNYAYASALNRIDATDTIVAIAYKK
tara:strand:- start:66 stop:950 length:885 start_codon:yes stop_codon:yes gene_type:complete